MIIQYTVYILDAPHRTKVSMALLRLSESGKLMELKDKWWSVSEEKLCPVITFITFIYSVEKY